ncbi:MAG: MotA/TolQ/ExbB proton channel family protein [Pirellulales bacterium]
MNSNRDHLFDGNAANGEPLDAQPDAVQLAEARLTAYVLGELDAEPHAAVETELAESEAARQQVSDIRRSVEMLTAAFATEPTAVLPAEHRLRLVNRVTSAHDVRPVSPPERLSRRTYGKYGLAASALLCLAGTLTAFLFASNYRDLASEIEFPDADMSGLVEFAGISIYVLQAFDALWGAFCIIVVWRRLAQIRFKTEDQQNAFLEPLLDAVSVGDFEGAAEVCEESPRIVPQLILLAINNRDLGYNKVEQLLADSFQREVVAEIEYRITWLVRTIKSAPMLGLLGTVLGMMAAFGKLAGAQKVDATHLAGDISLALVATFVGLMISIPLSLALAGVQIHTRKMEDLVGDGLARFMEVFKATFDQQPAEPVRS